MTVRLLASFDLHPPEDLDAPHAWDTRNPFEHLGSLLLLSSVQWTLERQWHLLISRMPGTGRERRDEVADVDCDNGRRNTGQVTTR